jgi:hypothetical protein
MKDKCTGKVVVTPAFQVYQGISFNNSMAESDNTDAPRTTKPDTAREITPGDEVRLRKPHPCGSYDWRVVRIGADIGLRCLGCDRRVTLPRSEFERRFKAYISHQT